MKIGLIDVDSHRFPNLALMKISAYHKKQGDTVEWYQPFLNERKLVVYVLCNYDTTIEQDLERIYTLRDIGYYAYVMLYNKESIPKGHKLRKMARWVNNRFIFSKCERFEDYID